VMEFDDESEFCCVMNNGSIKQTAKPKAAIPRRRAMREVLFFMAGYPF